MKLKKKEKCELFKRVSKYLEDVSKLVFAGVVLSSITKDDYNLWWMLSSGTFLVFVTMYGSYLAFIKSNN